MVSTARHRGAACEWESWNNLCAERIGSGQLNQRLGIHAGGSQAGLRWGTCAPAARRARASQTLPCEAARCKGATPFFSCNARVAFQYEPVSEHVGDVRLQDSIVIGRCQRVQER
eukprot:1729712-Rhodomonas_salina.3